MARSKRPTTESPKALDQRVVAELSPLDPAYERPESELPALSFPHSEEQAFRMAAELRRRVRIRNEAIFVALLAVIGVALLLSVHNPGLLALAVISALAVAAYEITVTALE